MWTNPKLSPTTPTHGPVDGAEASPLTNGTTTTIPATTTTPTTRVRNPGRRFAQIVKLKPEFRDQYKEVHSRVWPEVLGQIKASNITDYSIFYDEETGILFSSFKYIGYDYVGDMERMRENPRVQEWWKMTDGWQESMVPGAQSSEAGFPSWWKPLPEVFYTS